MYISSIHVYNHHTLPSRVNTCKNHYVYRIMTLEDFGHGTNLNSFSIVYIQIKLKKQPTLTQTVLCILCRTMYMYNLFQILSYLNLLCY